MQHREIRAYTVTRFADGRTYLGLTFEDRTCTTLQLFSPQEAMFLLDILRHEKPVYMDPHGSLFTGGEPVGEGDRDRD